MTESSDETTIKAPVQQQLAQKMEANFQPLHMELVNESHMHNVPSNSETHFKLIMVSDKFVDLRPVQRHQAVYKLLAQELSESVHALALHLYTPEEWNKRESVPNSPQCLGGSKR